MDLPVRRRQVPHSASDRQGHQTYLARNAFPWNRWLIVLQMQGAVEHPPTHTSLSESEKFIWRCLSGTKRLVADMDPSDHACQGASTSLYPSARSHSQRQGNG